MIGYKQNTKLIKEVQELLTNQKKAPNGAFHHRYCQWSMVNGR